MVLRRLVPGSVSVAADAARYKLLGLVFLLVIALFVALTVAFYTKAFRDAVPVVVKAERAGLQMSVHADVKIRGVIVGEVTEISSSDRVAVLRLALRPAKVDQIPADVRARLVPTTIFGEKYVSLVPPPDPAPRHIRAGAVIGVDRSEVAIELNRVFSSVLPLLRSIDPAKVNATLHALASALSGRGERIGRNLMALRTVVQGLNPSLPTIKEDIRLLADFAETYQQAVPDLLRVLENLTVTSNTIVAERDTLRSFLREVTTFATEGRGLLADTGQRLIRVNAVSRPTLDLLAHYSPEFPCLLKGLARLHPQLNEALDGNRLHITMELVKPRQPYEYPEDRPRGSFHAKLRTLREISGYDIQLGPHCYGLPDSPPVPFPGPAEFNRSGFAEPRPGVPAYRRDSAGGSSTGGVSGSSGASGGGGSSGGAADGGAGDGWLSLGRAQSGVLTDMSIGYVGSPAEQRLIDHLVGPVIGKPPRKVSDLATLLFGPMARGTVVKLR